MTGYLGVPPSCRPECSTSSDCEQSRACVNQRCIDPCPGSCAPNARCQVRGHNPICTCPQGYSGDPFVNCYVVKSKYPGHILAVPALDFFFFLFLICRIDETLVRLVLSTFSNSKWGKSISSMFLTWRYWHFFSARNLAELLLPKLRYENAYYGLKITTWSLCWFARSTEKIHLQRLIIHKTAPLNHKKTLALENCEKKKLRSSVNSQDFAARSDRTLPT